MYINLRFIISYVLLPLFAVIILLFSNCSKSTNNTVISSANANRISLKSMTFDNRNLGVYESSNYYPGARTNEGHALYVNEFPAHNIIRVNAVDWALSLVSSCTPIADYSNCINEFKNDLNLSKSYLTDLVSTNLTKILMVDIFRTPSWLSIHPDSTVACGGGVLGQSYRPKNYVIWKKLLDEAVKFTKQFEVNNTKIYYSFWNEPDLACNWQEGTPELLELYANTMPYIKSIHPSAKVGGPSVEAWNGKVQKDSSSRTQPFILDFIQYSKNQNLPLEFVTFHYYNTDYQGMFVDGLAQIRAYQQSLGISEDQMPIMLNEWLPQVGNPTGYNAFQAADSGNLFIAMHQVKLRGQGGMPWQDFGPNPGDQWGIVTYSPLIKKPTYYVYKFFDEISRTSLGINYWSENIEVDLPNLTASKKFKYGEKRFIFSKEANLCYKFGTWNRTAQADEASIYYLLSEGITIAELQNAYGQNPVPNLIIAIKAGQPFDEKWRKQFENAKSIYFTIDDVRTNKEFNYSLIFSDFNSFASVSAKSYGRDGVYIQDKSLSPQQNNLTFSLKTEEVMLSTLCFK